MLTEAREKDEEEDQLFGKDSRGDEIPEELKDRRSRLAREKEEKVQCQAERIEKRKEEEETIGHKKRGRKPKGPAKTGQKEAKANLADPDSRIMNLL
jgi:phosphoenolpyruvate synthase/pyruvate phosphate dikinase